MTDKLPFPCEHCGATGIRQGIECEECRGKGYRLVIDGRMAAVKPAPAQQRPRKSAPGPRGGGRRQYK